MNKKEFIKALSEEIHYNEKDTIQINKILEKNFFISRKNKPAIIEELCTTFTISENEASIIYEKAKTIFNKEMKKSLLHPFKNKN